MNNVKLKKITNELMHALFCHDTFQFPISSEYPDIHIVSKVKILQKEIDDMKEEIKSLYDMEYFIPIIPEKDSEIYKCQYSKIFGNVKKLSEIIYYLKSLKLNLDTDTLGLILGRKIDPDMDINEEDINKFNERINLFEFLVIKSQREQYINEINRREKKIDIIYKKIEYKRNFLNEQKSKESYQLLSNLESVKDLLRNQYTKKITIFFHIFRGDLKSMKLSKEIIKLLKSNYNWRNISNLEIEKMIDFICIVLTDKLIRLYESKNELNELIKKMNKLRNIIHNLLNNK